MNRPRFSVIVAAYNASRTIRETVESVLAQSYRDFELIVVDDGSTDDTLAIILQLAASDRRIRVIRRTNGGVSAARNLGADRAMGDLLAFLDADDLWHPEKLARHHRLHLADPGVRASFARIAFCPDTDGPLVPGRTVSTVPAEACTLDDVLIENAVCTMSNLVVDHAAFAVIGGFDAAMRHVEDQDILARLVGAGYVLRGIDETLVHYRLSPEGLSCDFAAMFDGWRQLAGRWSHAIDVRRGEALYCRYLARRTLRSGGPAAQARAFVRRGMACDAAAFLNGGMRGLLTMSGALVAGILPVRVRAALFA